MWQGFQKRAGSAKASHLAIRILQMVLVIQLVPNSEDSETLLLEFDLAKSMLILNVGML